MIVVDGKQNLIECCQRYALLFFWQCLDDQLTDIFYLKALWCTQKIEHLIDVHYTSVNSVHSELIRLEPWIESCWDTDFIYNLFNSSPHKVFCTNLQIDYWTESPTT